MAKRGLASGLLIVLAALAAEAAAAALPSRSGAHGAILISGAKTFPIVLSSPPAMGSKAPDGGDGWTEVLRAGVTLLKYSPTGDHWTAGDIDYAATFTDVAAAHHAKTWINLKDLSNAPAGSAREATLRTLVKRLRGKRGLGLWKGADEPWWNSMSATSLANAYRVTRELDPAHEFVMIQAPRGTGADLSPYSEVTDVHGVDIYPVSWVHRADPPLHDVGTWTHTLAVATPNRSIMTAVQICFSGSDDPAGSGAFVMPTRRQERYMIYDAILSGARGLSFFGGDIPHCLTGSDVARGWNWKYWNRTLSPLVHEIGPHGPLYAALKAPGTGLGLRVSDATVGIMSRQVGKTIWVMAAARGAGTRSVTIRGLPAGIPDGIVYREGRKITVRNGAITDTFGRWGVHVYRFVRP